MGQGRISQQRPWLLGALLSMLVGATIWTSTLVGDEVFVLFGFTNDLESSPGLIVDWAIRSSIGGWDTGRFTSPLTHLVSNAGVYATGATSSLFSIDLITAYSAWRALLLVVTTMLSILLVRGMWPSRSHGPRNVVLALVAVLVPAATVANTSFVATRITIWSYSIIFIVMLLFVNAYIYLPQWKWARRRRHFNWFLITGAVALGLLCGTTYELTQILFPIALIAYWASRIVPRGWPVRGFFARTRFLLDLYAVTFAVSAIAGTLFIRVSAYLYCQQTGCYGPANVAPSGSLPAAFVTTLISSVPPLPQIAAIPSGGPPLDDSQHAVVFGLFFIIFLAAAWYALRGSRDWTRRDRQAVRRLSVSLLLVGLTTIALIAFGLSASSEVATRIEELRATLGRGGRGTLYQNFGVAIAFCGVVLWCVSRVAGRASERHFSIAVASLLIGLLGAGSAVANLSESRAASFERTASFQHLAAAELRFFDGSTSADRRRCDLVTLKLRELGEWEGHDRALVFGLNSWAQRLYGKPFCSAPAEDLFRDFYVDPTVVRRSTAP